MSFSTFTNIVTTLFCLAVLVQSVRMMRSLRAVKDGALSEVVGALDASTKEARAVLSELKAALGECTGNARVLTESRSMAEELGVMIGIANASAERLVEASSAANRGRADGGDQADAETHAEAAA